MLCTIYFLRNKINDKIYVGQTWESLKNLFDNGNGYQNCLLLYNAMLKHGIENFYYEVKTFCGTQETADYWESYFIEKYETCNRVKGYNLRSGGSRGKQSAETKKRMSLAQKGRIVSVSTKEKLSKILKANPIRMIGLDNPMFGVGDKHPMYGKNHTPETRRLMSESKTGKPSPNKGKTMSENSRKKMSESKKGKPAHNKGKPMSEESKKKMSEAAKKRHAKILA